MLLTDDIADRLVESVNEIFTGMVMMDIELLEKPTEKLGQLTNSITGMIGLAGIHKGVIAIHIPNNVAMTITSNFLGLEVDEVNEDVQDAIGEIANMLGGSFKAILSDKGKDIQLSLPSTISGEEYVFNAAEEGDFIVLSFRSAEGDFHIEVELEA